MREFLATLKTCWWPSAVVFFFLWSGCCLFGTFPISILNFMWPRHDLYQTRNVTYVSINNKVITCIILLSKYPNLDVFVFVSEMQDKAYHFVLMRAVRVQCITHIVVEVISYLDHSLFNTHFPWTKTSLYFE